ncbi:MAG: mannosyltransferase family protein [Anaerolineae bacterium]
MPSQIIQERLNAKILTVQSSQDILKRLQRRLYTDRFPLVLWGGLRILTLIWAIIAISVLPVRSLSLAGDPPRVPPTGWDILIEPWARWDTLWYLRIAARGYSTTDLTGGFFPLYPLLIRGLSFVIPNPLLCALIISTLATLGAALVFYRLAQDCLGEMTARRALLYWLLFPTSFYFLGGYAESLCVLMTLLSLRAARQGRWGWAGLAGAFAALARPPGFLILVPLGIEWLQARGSTYERVRRAAPLTLVPIALALYMLYLYWQFNDPFFWLNAWHNVTIMPWDMAFKTLQFILAGVALPNNLIDFSFTVLVLGLTGIGIRRIPLSLTAFAFALILVQMMAYPPGLGFVETPMEGFARRAAFVFPAFLVLAQVWRGRLKEPLWIGVSLIIQLTFISIFVCWLWLA